MSYPQTQPGTAIQNGQELWRLFTPLESSGDIYESDVSARAVVIGPDSDIARAGITYYDRQSTNIANMATVSVDKPWIGRLDALASQNYQTEDRARILINTEDLIPPAGFTVPLATINAAVEIIVPNIDLLFYLNEEPSFIPQRSNKVYLFENLISADSEDPQWFLVPFYERRLAEITVKMLNFVGTQATTVNIFGLNFSNTLAGPLVDTGHQQLLLGTIDLPQPLAGDVGPTGSFTVTGRSFDYLAISVAQEGEVQFPNINSLSIHIVVSDR